MKRKVLLSSILVIALCLSLIAGSTFALFTDKEQFNIAVTSGNVDIIANVSKITVYSAVATTVNPNTPAFLIDENGNHYEHVAQTSNDDFSGTFLNGGTATYASGLVDIVRITPGDKVDIEISIDNYSNVAFTYRYKIVATDAGLGEAMVVSFNGTSYESVKVWASDWIDVPYDANNTPAIIAPVTVSIELPVYVGNEYQSDVANNITKSVSYIVMVEAVQGNGVTTDTPIEYFGTNTNP